MKRALIALGCVLALTGPSLAVDPDERLADPVLEARAKAVGRELRCVVCQSQSIEESDAPLAQDLRRLVRERIVAGDADAEVLDHVAARYGDYVLMRPPMRGSTIVLWAAPAGLLLAGAGVAFLFLGSRRQGAGEAAPAVAPAAARTTLSDDERRRLTELDLKTERR